MTKNKKIVKIVIIFSIIGILISGYYFCIGRKVVIVNENNKQVILDLLEGETKNEDKLKMVKRLTYRMRWTSPEVYVYYKFNEKEEIIIDVGRRGAISDYIRENGYEEKNIALAFIKILGVVTILNSIGLIGICIFEKKKEK